MRFSSLFRKKALGWISLGVVLGMAIYFGVGQVMEQTSQQAFCVSCHSMQQANHEQQQSVHGLNRAGIDVQCADCHLPHSGFDKFVRKIQAIKEIYFEMSGKLRTPEDFEQHRLALAQREWERMRANGSAECKSCHSYAKMDFDKMSDKAKTAMRPAAEKDQSCIDCHKGVAHQLPTNEGNNTTTNTQQFDQFVSQTHLSNQTYYTKAVTELFLDENLSQSIGQLESAVPVQFVQSANNADLVLLTMWRKNKGYGRIWYFDFAKNIIDAVLSKEFMSEEPRYNVLESREDPITGLVWQKVQLQAWIAQSQLIDDITPIWAKTEEQYKTQCSVCHKQPDIAHFDANNWVGLFNGMVGFTNLDKPSAKEVLRYLQLHAADSQKATTQH